MIDINELRRLAQAALAAPDGLSAEWMDRLGQFQEAADASVVSELLDRLEAAESETASWKGLATQFGHENDKLRAKVAEMEQQEPVAKVRVHQTGGNAGLAWSVAPLNDFDALPLMRDGSTLYALPGAKGE